MDSQVLLTLIKTRRSIRRYQDRPVPDDLVTQILEAARWAPSATNRQPWEFIVVADPAVRREVARYAASYFVRWAHVADAPLLILLCGEAGWPYRDVDVALASMQLMLQAHAVGLGTCWVGALEREPLRQLLKVPAGVEIVGLVTAGYPAEDPPPPRRKPLADLVHYDVYGNRLPGVAEPGRVKAGPLTVVLRRLRLPIRF